MIVRLPAEGQKEKCKVEGGHMIKTDDSALELCSIGSWGFLEDYTLISIPTPERLIAILLLFKM